MTEENLTQDAEPQEAPVAEDVVQSRRDFLISLGKWSAVVVTGAVVGAGVLAPERDAQAGVWINNRGGYGGGWYNRAGGGGGWINGGGGGWVNRRGGYGGSWINR